MFDFISLSTAVTVVPDFGTFKRCAECRALLNATNSGVSCSRCDDCRVWLDVIEEYHAHYPVTRNVPRILIERPAYADLIADE